MPLKFKPHFTISPVIARNLMRIEAAKEQIGQVSIDVKSASIIA